MKPGGNPEVTDLTIQTADGDVRRMSTTASRFDRMGRQTSGSDTRRFNRNLALLARELVPPELLIEFHLAILQGHNPIIKQDARAKGGWVVWWDEKTEQVPNLEQKVRSVDFLRQAGWGLPAQAHYVDLDVKTAQAAPAIDITAVANSPRALSAMVGALRAALDAGKAQKVLDAESREAGGSR